jgi:hemerythrin-like domain-containing protein
MQEHKLILRALDVLDTMAAAAEKNGRMDETDLARVLDFLRWFADAHHQAKEERILFPELRRAAASQGRPVEHMMLEHDQDRQLIEQIEAAVRIHRFDDFVKCADKLSTLLRNHIYKEDQILFEVTREALDAKTDDEVLARLNRFETDLDAQVLKEKMEELRALEWKYLRRAS